jgi:type IV secretion system protein VirD4
MGRSYGTLVYGIAQTMSSLKKYYVQELETILSSSLLMFLSITTPNDLEYISKKLGHKTVFTESDSKSDQKTSESHTTSAVKRELLTSHEINELSYDHVFVFIDKLRPLILKKLKFFEDKNYKSLTKRT